ncbi:MAG: peptide deformylase [Candidatus Paceibacterota bacterium]
MVKIIQKGDPLLEKRAKEVPPSTRGTTKLAKIITDMQTAMHNEDDSVAIAAPQIGVSLRMFVVSGPFYEGTYGKEEERGSKKKEGKDLVFINPKITKHSKKTSLSEEGCLSVRPWYGEVTRYKNVTVEAQDEKGRRFTRGAGGLLAQIFQHEIDHLDGILFDSKAKHLRIMKLNDTTEEFHEE